MAAFTADEMAVITAHCADKTALTVDRLATWDRIVAKSTAIVAETDYSEPSGKVAWSNRAR